jgi:hypothetical protein
MTGLGPGFLEAAGNKTVPMSRDTYPEEKTTTLFLRTHSCTLTLLQTCMPATVDIGIFGLIRRFRQWARSSRKRTGWWASVVSIADGTLGARQTGSRCRQQIERIPGIACNRGQRRRVFDSFREMLVRENDTSV